MKVLRVSALFIFVATSVFATPPAVPHATGVAHTEQVDLGYETFGTLGTALPIIAVNGGPGLSHAYMMQNDLWQRIAEHQTGARRGYTSKRRPVALVWSEHFERIVDAIAVERKIKGWSRAKKQALIESD